MGFPWSVLHSWKPFHVDALGLVTFLGSEEVDLYIGRLVPSRWLEYMPLLGAFVIAGDRFKEKKPSFSLYNISSGITTSDLSSWFTRWMLAQEFEVSRSVVYWEIMEEAREWWPYYAIAGAISFSFMGFLIAMTVISEDWYGFANAVATILSIIVRTYILQVNRNAVDRAVLDAKPLPGTFEHAEKEWNDKAKDGQSPGPKPNDVNKRKGTQWKPEQAKILIVMSDSKAVTMFIPEQLIISVFVNNTKPCIKWLYESFRWMGWAAFAVHIITIGLAELVTQMYTIAILIIPTVLLCWKIGCDDSRKDRRLRSFSDDDMGLGYECWIGSHLKATIFEWPRDAEFKETKKGSHQWRREGPAGKGKRSTRRQDLYAWLDLSADEEDSMGKWDLLPHKRNDDDTWSSDFNAKKFLIRSNPINIRSTKNAVAKKIKQEKLRSRLHGGTQNVGDDVELSKGLTPQNVDPLGSTRVQRPNTKLSASGMPISSAPAPPGQSGAQAG